MIVLLLLETDNKLMKNVTKTFSAKQEDYKRGDSAWYIVDADGVSLGRMAVKIANTLRGKDKAVFTPHVDTGSFVVVINAEKVGLTGRKIDQKIYYRHSGYIGSLKSATAREMLESKPDQVIRKAVERMLPKNRLSRQLMEKLKVYSGPAHPHEAQKPKPLEIT